jgi:hypothetical protein
VPVPVERKPEPGSFPRHAAPAALGITDESDAIVVVVSEETGIVSFVHRGKMERPVSLEQLRALLLKFYAQLEDRSPLTAGAENETAGVAGGRNH